MHHPDRMERVVIIGNGGGGKSTLAHALAARTGLPWHEVDRLQFQPGWARTPEPELRAALAAIVAQPRWIVDGFGPWDTIEARVDRADTLILVDHPIWVHFWWASERQLAAARGERRLGGPEACDLTEVHRRMFETIWRVHEQLRPKLLTLAERAAARIEVHHIRSPEALNAALEALAR